MTQRVATRAALGATPGYLQELERRGDRQGLRARRRERVAVQPVPPAESFSPVPGIPLAFDLVWAVPALSLSIGHGWDPRSRPMSSSASLPEGDTRIRALRCAESRLKLPEVRVVNSARNRPRRVVRDRETGAARRLAEQSFDGRQAPLHSAFIPPAGRGGACSDGRDRLLLGADGTQSAGGSAAACRSSKSDVAMPTPTTVKPTQKAVKTYYAALNTYADQGVDNESALRSAFQNLLADTGKRFGWTLIPEQADTSGGKAIRPDGTFRDRNSLRRGHWEAKDTKDDLEAEIQKKIAKGYPLGNIIFEDTRQAYLYQNRQQTMKVDLREPRQLADLLNAFFAYTEPAHEDFNKAIEEFKERVPELARGLVAKIEEAHQDNRKFQGAFAQFYELCKTSLNPNLSREAVDEMLVQHLLTERLIRTIFDREDFKRRNVIAAEVERVIDALVSQSFSRHEFLRSLDRFYVAIEAAADTIESFTEKQHFLNVVYEQFFQGYSVKVADTMGIVYTPQQIVDFMCASVEEVLKTDFNTHLGAPGVNILDPCTGTGNFIVNFIRRIPKRDLPRMYREQLFANEVMLLPYYIAALNIEHAYYEKTGEYEPFEGLCFVDTLDLAEDRDAAGLTQTTLPGFKVEQNIIRVERQTKTPITVIIGNPPYNARQQNENDNNKNRVYHQVEKRVKDTYSKDSSATNKNVFRDPYIKFLRWATDRLGDRDGIVALITNNGFVHKFAYDGMRTHLVSDFQLLHHLDLHGDRRRGLQLTGTTHNVFGIPIGVGITIAVRKKAHDDNRLFLHNVPEAWRKQQKLGWLAERHSIADVVWRPVEANSRSLWMVQENVEEFESSLPMGQKVWKSQEAGRANVLFNRYCPGVVTSRDAWMYGEQEANLIPRVEALIETYNMEVDRWKRIAEPGASVDDFVLYDDRRIKWSRDLKNDLQRGHYAHFSETKIRQALYRPFHRMFLFYDPICNEEPRAFGDFFPGAIAEKENQLICVSGPGNDDFRCLVANGIADYKFSNPANGGTQCFPFHIYDEDGSNRRENVTDWALEKFRGHYRDKKISKWDIFYYVYGLLHHPGYRERFAENLKRELPRIPLAPGFRAFADAGQELARLHLDYEQLEPHPLDWIETPDVPLSYHVEKMRLSKDKKALKVNDSLTLAAIPPEVFDYRLGNRSALEWVIDQYRIKTDKRSGIRSDPNRPDDEEYIVRLVGQVVHVSLETVKIVRALPEDFGRGRD